MEPYVERERAWLAPYAFPSAASRGRKYDEPAHRYRGPFQRDRDRILHSSAFRRLSGKMQVFTGEMGDYHRTRLTHTMEVASIARTIARVLRLNEDLVEALALFHDIGHPPFGHAGEDVIRECLADEGGFSHNAFAITLAEELELRYAGYPGLNLSQEVLDGQRVRAGDKGRRVRPLLEVQVVEAADSVTYNAHDLDDALVLELVSLDQLREIPLVAPILERVQQKLGNPDGSVLRQVVVRELLDAQVGAVIAYSSRYLEESGWTSPTDALASSFFVGLNPAEEGEKKNLERFLFQQVYRHPRLLVVREQAQREIRELFEALHRDPALLPDPFLARAASHGTRRACGECIAMLTDDGCRRMHAARCMGSTNE